MTSKRILPFFIKESKEKLTDRTSLALIDEFMIGIGLSSYVKRTFPKPGSGKGIKGLDYIRCLIFHFLDGGRFLEEIQPIRSDKGFRKLIKMKRMPGFDATGDWLRRCGKRSYMKYIEQSSDFLVRRYVKSSSSEALTLDVDSTLIESNKGDAHYSYKGIHCYHPMLGYLSNGRDEPMCSYAKFRQGNASAQEDILEALKHTLSVLPKANQLKYFRSDSAAYQSRIVNACNQESIYYTITADMDTAVREAIAGIDELSWLRLHDPQEGFEKEVEYAETVHAMNKSDHGFRLILQRKVNKQFSLFAEDNKWRYHGIITNMPQELMNTEQVIFHHNARGNAERFIGEGKYGLNLKYVPCGQFEANAMYFVIGMLSYNLIKLMQLLVLPKDWSKKMIRSIRTHLFRMAAKVVTTRRQVHVYANKSTEEIKELLGIREKIWELANA